MVECGHVSNVHLPIVRVAAWRAYETGPGGTADAPPVDAILSIT